MTEPVDLSFSDMHLTFPKPQEKKLLLIALLPLLISLFAVSACDILGSDPEEQTQIRFISFVSGSPALTATVSGETIPIPSFVLSSTPSGPSGVPGFVSVESGSRRYQVAAASSDATVLRGTVSLSADTLYTGYVTGDAAEASLTLVGDMSPNAPAEGSLIRVVHAYSRVGVAELAVHEVTPSPGGGLDAGAEIASTGALAHGDTSDLMAISEEQVAIVASSGARQGPTLLLSPVGGRLYTIVLTPPGGQFSNTIFGVGVYQEEI